jgi:hypothetical protein
MMSNSGSKNRTAPDKDSDKEVNWTLRVVNHVDGLALGEIGNICVAIWRKDATRARFELQKAGLAEVAARHPGNIGFFCVVEQTSGVPNDEIRKASSLMFQSYGKDLRSVVMVIEGTGFRSAVVRSVAAGIVMLVGSRTTPISYVATVDEGAPRLKEHVDIRETSRFIREVEALRLGMNPIHK